MDAFQREHLVLDDVAYADENGLVQEHVRDLFFLLADSTNDKQLKALFLSHRAETVTQVGRLEAAFAELKETPNVFPTCTVDGLMADGRWTIHTLKGDPALDRALLAAAQRTEALEVAMYNGLIQAAKELGHAKVAELCGSNLAEERAAQKALTTIMQPQPAGDLAL